MPSESAFPGWASDTNYTVGSYRGSPTKVAPSAAEEAQGFVDGQSFHSGYANYHVARIESWLADTARAIYGDGSDGNATITGGTTTLTRDMYYDNLTVESTGVLATNGFRVFVRDLLTVEASGVIHNDGGNASGATAGVGVVGSINGGGDGGSTGPVAPDSVSNGLGGSGGDGGASGTTGQTAATPTVPPATSGGYRDLHTLMTSYLIDGNYLRGGGGGGAGEDNGASGGGGGAGGGIVLICAFRVSNEGAIRAAGGNGGNGTGSNAAGGGAGGGGLVILVSRGYEGAGTVTAPTGTVGTGSGTGQDGYPGTSGTVLQVTA